MLDRYLAILDFFVVAHRKVEDLDEGQESGDEVEDEVPHEDEDKSPQSQREQEKLPVKDQPKVAIAYEHDQKGQRTNSMDPDTRADDEGSGQKLPLLPRCPEWVEIASLEHHLRCHTKQSISETQLCPAKDDEHFWQYYDGNLSTASEKPCPSISHYALRAMMDNKPLRPFKDSPKPLSLASVTGKNKSRNQDIDILAVIESIDASTTKPARLSLKRDIRIVDPSVDEPVTVSIFMDPVNFRSTVGTVALFRHVTTHDWRRGNLNAYPARVKGREWFIPSPFCLGLDKDVRHLQTWWENHCG